MNQAAKVLGGGRRFSNELFCNHVHMSHVHKIFYFDKSYQYMTHSDLSNI
jgi:hypothetical protein